MRYASIAGTAVVLSAALFASCTCHKQLEQPPTTFSERPSGWPAASKGTPQMQAQAPTPSPMHQPEQVATGPTPTIPSQIPDDFPKDVPIFKGAELAQVQSLANDAHNVIFNTTAPVEDVAHFYDEQLTKAGWKITQQFARGDHAFATYQKDDLIANVTIADDAKNPGQKVIAIMYEHQKPLDFPEF